MKVVISGISGFVGTNLKAYLSAFNKFAVEPLDLRRDDIASSIKNAKAVVHLAGKAHDLKKTAEPDEYYHVNFELTKKLYNEFLSSEARVFIFISSVKAVADETTGILTEIVQPDPKTHYGRSKLMAEQYIQSQPLPADKRYYILRPCMIHGPGNKGNLNLLYNFVKKGIPYPLAAFHNKRSFLSVQNLCFVIKHCIESDSIETGVYQVADDEAISTNELIELISAAIGKRSHLWRIPIVLINGAAKIGDIFKLPLNTERLEKLTQSYVVSNAKIIQAMGENLPVDTRTGIATTITSFNDTAISINRA